MDHRLDFYRIDQKIESGERRQLAEQIGKSIESKRDGKEKAEVDFAAMTDFSWDKMYIFTPYTAKESISRALGFKWSGESSIEYSESINLVVFVKGNRLVQYVELSRKYGDFTVDRKNGFMPGETVENFAIH